MGEEITRREALKQGALLGGAALVWVRPSVQTYGMSATLAAQASGTAGCTPGFWKNNPGRWPNGIVPGDPVPWTGTEIGTPTFGNALAFKGGGGIAGAERILFRAAAAGHLNALSLGGYEFSPGQLASLVNTAVASGDRDTILAAAADIDTENNAGCPIPADEGNDDYTEDGQTHRVEEEKLSDEVFGDDDSEPEEPKTDSSERSRGGSDDE